MLRVSVHVGDDASPIAGLPGHAATTFLHRFIASPSPDVPDIEQLFELKSRRDDHVSGVARDRTIAFGQADDEELQALGDVEVTGGYLYQRGWTTAPTARLLHDYGQGGPTKT